MHYAPLRLRYIAAILQGHVVPAIPYISDAATYSPESCVFGQFINMGCVLRKSLTYKISIFVIKHFQIQFVFHAVGIVIYIRYRQIRQLSTNDAELYAATGRLSWWALWIGFGSCLGCSIVGNFQETNVRMVHFVGAFCCFGLGTIYFWLQAILSYYLYPKAGTMMVAHIRLVLAALCTIFFIVVAVTGIISHILFKGQDPRKW